MGQDHKDVTDKTKLYRYRSQAVSGLAGMMQLVDTSADTDKDWEVGSHLLCTLLCILSIVNQGASRMCCVVYVLNHSVALGCRSDRLTTRTSWIRARREQGDSAAARLSHKFPKARRRTRGYS
eukprot:326833-Rhodomonas_salina.1